VHKTSGSKKGVAGSIGEGDSDDLLRPVAELHVWLYQSAYEGSSGNVCPHPRPNGNSSKSNQNSGNKIKF
jgi:hypothetical protein